MGKENLPGKFPQFVSEKVAVTTDIFLIGGVDLLEEKPR
jgi:hypothetical protein